MAVSGSWRWQTAIRWLERKINRVAIIFDTKRDVFAVIPDWSQLSRFSSSNSNIIDDDYKETVKKKRKVELIQGIEILLQSIGKYRKKQPENDQ